MGEGNETFLIRVYWIVKFHVGWRGKRNIPYKGVLDCEIPRWLERKRNIPYKGVLDCEIPCWLERGTKHSL